MLCNYLLHWFPNISMAPKETGTNPSLSPKHLRKFMIPVTCGQSVGPLCSAIEMSFPSESHLHMSSRSPAPGNNSPVHTSTLLCRDGLNGEVAGSGLASHLGWLAPLELAIRPHTPVCVARAMTM